MRALVNAMSKECKNNRRQREVSHSVTLMFSQRALASLARRTYVGGQQTARHGRRNFSQTLKRQSQFGKDRNTIGVRFISALPKLPRDILIK